MRCLLLTIALLLLPRITPAEQLFFWSGNVGTSNIKLFITGPTFPDKYTPPDEAAARFYKSHKNGVNAFYLYDKYKKGLSLVGTINDKHWKFDEHKGAICTNCKPNGYFDGVQKGDTVSGFWYSADSSKRLPFRIKKAPLLKKTIFGWLRGGEWVLDGAEGFYGANTMTNLGKDQKGRWVAGGSGISNARRQGYDTKLSVEEKKLLSGLRISVTSSLGLVVKSATKEILRITYQEDPFFKLEHITPETDGIGRIHKFQEQPGVTFSVVNIATTDIGTFDDIIKVEALPYDTPSAAHIDYLIDGDLFNITLVSADCCAYQTLTFKRAAVPVKH